MTRWVSQRIILPAILLVGLAAYLLVALAMVFAATRAEREPFEAQPENFGLQYEDVDFPSRGSDLRLDGWLLRGAPEAPFLVFVHGVGGQRTAGGALELAARLVDDGSGYNVLLFDLRAHGSSEGERVTGGDSERDDVLGAYDFVLGRGAEPSRVGLIGFSMGAGVSIMAAAQEPGVGAVVADSPFANVSDLISQETARKTPIPEGVVPLFLPAARLFADLLYDIDLGDLKPERDVASLDYPVLVIHGEADQRISVEQGRRVHQNAPTGSELWTLPGVDHVDAFLEQPDEYVRRVEAYLASRFEPILNR